MTTHAISRPPAKQALEDLLEGLAGSSDLELATELRFFHPEYMMLVGAHSNDGWCWCQPTDTEIHTNGGYHDHPVHTDQVH